MVLKHLSRIRSKLAVFLTKALIGSNHLLCHCVISSADLFQRMLNRLVPWLKRF